MQAYTDLTQGTMGNTHPEANDNDNDDNNPSNNKRLKLRSIAAQGAGSLVLALVMLAQPVSATVASHSTPPQSSSRVAQALPATGAPTYSQYFAPTGKTVSGYFLDTFQRYGLDRIGYPLSNEQQENGRTVQYFERVRMEYHPELVSKGFGVLMTRLGADMTQNAPFAPVASFQANPARTYVPQTGHSLAEPFRSYWNNNGGLQLFGYPISEPMTQDGLMVQWFERARFEYHPELKGTGQEIELTQLGRMAYDKQNNQATQFNAQLVNEKVAPAPPAPPAKQPAAAQNNLSGMESVVLQAINGQRAAAGLAQVTLDNAIIALSRARSSDMAARNYFSHTTPDGMQFLNMLQDRNIPFKYAAEILARNNYPDDQAAKVAADSYLNSPPHKAIIMEARYTTVGIGYAKSADGMHYFTVIFVQN